jgi:hypothetical protein
MTPRERFLSTLRFERPDDRLPMVEWADRWGLTLNRWRAEGLPKDLNGEALNDSFGLDTLVCLYGFARSDRLPRSAGDGASVLTDEASYESIRPYLFTDACIQNCVNAARACRKRHERGEIAVRLWLDGFFWLPRALWGIRNHLFAFYDAPELMRRINGDLADFSLRLTEAVFSVLTPDMVGFAEDMSYNHGPMLSREMFDAFLLPFYRKVIPFIKRCGVKVFADSDGDVTAMIPWLMEAGIDGVYPLERQAGVDAAAIRRRYPSFLMLGAYDKRVMSMGEEAMRAEFERLLPVMRSGGFIASVDHQTPPEVSLEQYRKYLLLYREFCERAVS